MLSKTLPPQREGQERDFERRMSERLSTVGRDLWTNIGENIEPLPRNQLVELLAVAEVTLSLGPSASGETDLDEGTP